MADVLVRARDEGITHVAFGDIYLEDVRDYRIRQMAGTGIEPLFPLWVGKGRAPSLAREMIEAGLSAVVTCIDPRYLPEKFIGRRYDARFLAELPQDVEPCGERGEFHTFCCAGPMFDREIVVEVGQIVRRDGFCFVDVLPAARR